MKKLISFFALVLTFTILLTACKNNTSNGTSSDTTPQSTPAINSPSESVPVSEPQISESSSGESSVILSSTPPVTPQLVNVKVGPYDIYDSLNSRGLSTAKMGYGFGVAKNGKPHSLSVNNQLRFDGMKNVSALALDTKCTDKRMYLTFDCGWEYNNLTDDILNTLKEKQVTAAFFVTLSYVKQNPALVRKMIDEGHIVANHSATHPSFPKITREQMANEIWKLEEYLQTNFNYSSKYFRFPSGEHSDCALELVSSMGYSSIFWSVAYADWDVSKQPSKEEAVSTVTSRYHNGAVILLHAVSQSNADGLGDMIDIAVNEGYAFKSLDEYNK